MSHIWMRHVIHMNASCHSYECAMSHMRMRHVTHINATCHTYTYECVMSHLWMRHVKHMNESYHTYEWVMSHIWMSHTTHMNESRHAYVRNTAAKKQCRSAKGPSPPKSPCLFWTDKHFKGNTRKKTRHTQHINQKYKCRNKKGG